MIDVLDDFLLSNVSQEMYDLLADTDDLFTKLGIARQDDTFVEIVLTADNRDPTDVVSEILGVTLVLCKDITDKHGIHLQFLEGDADKLKVYNTVIRGLLTLMDYDSPDELLNISQQTIACEEMLCEMLSVVTTETTDNLLQYVEWVNPTLVTNIVALNEKEELPEPKDIAALKVMAEQARVYMEFLKEDSMIATMLSSGVELGYSRETYFQLLDPYFAQLSMRDPKDYRKVAVELLFTALISKETYTKPTTEVMNGIERWFTDISQTTRVQICVKELTLELEKFRNKKGTL